MSQAKTPKRPKRPKRPTFKLVVQNDGAKTTVSGPCSSEEGFALIMLASGTDAKATDAITVAQVALVKACRLRLEEIDREKAVQKDKASS